MKTPPVDLANRLREASADILRLDAEPNFDEISERTGVARATLYYYFSGRDDLNAFLLASHLEEAADLFSAPDGDDPALRLRKVLPSMVEFLAAHPGVCAGLLTALGSGMQMAEVLRANDKVVGVPLRRILRDGKNAGVFTFEDDHDTANAFMGAILSAVLGRAIADRPLDESTFSQNLTDLLLRSIAVD